MTTQLHKCCRLNITQQLMSEVFSIAICEKERQTFESVLE